MMLNQLSALVVSNRNENSKLLASDLAVIGINPILCQDAEQAITLFKAHYFQLIIVEEELPALSGLEFSSLIRTIEKQQQHLSAIIVILTNGTKPAIHYHTDKIQYFIKPLNINELHHFLQQQHLLFTDLAENAADEKSNAPIALAEEYHHRDDLFLDDANEQDRASLDAGGQTTASASAAIVNLTEIYQYTGEISDDDLQKFLLQYKSNLKNRRLECQQAFENDDFAKVHSVAHTVKSSALYIGAHVLNVACQRLEYAVAKQPIDQAEVLAIWTEANREMHAVLGYLDNMEL